MKNYNVSEEIAEKLMGFHASDYGNAQSLELLYGDQFCHVEAWGLLHYNGKFWEKEHADKALYEVTIEMMKIRGTLALEKEKEVIQKCVGTSNYKVNGAIASFLKFSSIARYVEDFNNDKHLLNVANGVVNLKTGELLPHSPSFGFTYCTPIAYNKDADSKVWIDYLTAVIQDYDKAEIADYIQMCVGYTLTGSIKEEKMFYLFGPTRSGKSTFLRVLDGILGESLAGTARFSTFTKKRDGNDQGFDLAPLHACRFVAASESESGTKMNEAVIKNITGGEKVTASFKNKTDFKFLPQWKIWVSSNFKPEGDVTDDAFWNRLNMVNFPNSFVGNEDKDLKEKMTSKEVLEGVLKWAVDGSIAWFASNQGLSTPDVFKDALNEARDQLDLTAQWLDDNCIIDKGDKKTHTPYTVLYQDFEKWCKINGESNPWKDRTFNKIMRDKGFIEGSAQYIFTELTNFNQTKKVKRVARGLFGVSIKVNTE